MGETLEEPQPVWDQFDTAHVQIIYDTTDCQWYCGKTTMAARTFGKPSERTAALRLERHSFPPAPAGSWELLPSRRILPVPPLELPQMVPCPQSGLRVYALM